MLMDDIRSDPMVIRESKSHATRVAVIVIEPQEKSLAVSHGKQQRVTESQAILVRSGLSTKPEALEVWDRARA
jgi:hypothetical protein